MVAGGFALWAAFRFLGLEGGIFPVVQLVAFTPYALLLGTLALVGVLALRRWQAAGLVLAAVVALAVMVLPREFGEAESVSGGIPVRVLSANLAKGGADSTRLLGLARGNDADLVFLQEVSARKVRELDRAGFPDEYPHRVLDVTRTNGGGAIFSRWPLRQLNSLEEGRQPRARVRVPGSISLEVISIHPTAPIKPGTTLDWDRDYRFLPAAGSADDPLVLAGDFNATLDHENLRQLIGTGYRDAADVTGNGFVSTWPSGAGRSLPVTIDHVLAERGILFSEYRVEELKGSDHRAVFAELVIPPGELR
jgi:endonuclease/exonuclease/phosphatase (EEP) superfamily protein YafD